MLGTAPVQWHNFQRSAFVAFALLTACVAAVAPSVAPSVPRACPVPDLPSSLGLGDTAQRFNELRTCPRLAFPTGNSLRHLTASELLHNITAADRASSPAAVVLFFYKASGCPFSASFLPVVQCSAAFFSPDVPFIALQQEAVGPISTRGGLLLQQLGLSAAPVIRIHTGRSKFMKHSGPRTLMDLVQVIGSQNGTGIAPLKTPAEAISECPAIGQPGNATADMPCWCLPQFQEAIVTASDIARLGSNLWMLSAVAFLVRFSHLNDMQQDAPKFKSWGILCIALHPSSGH